MNTHLRIVIILGILSVLFFSTCKKDQGLVSIVVQSDNSQVDAGNFESFKFDVIGNDGKVYTGNSEIFVNDKKIDDNQYYPDDAGTYNVYATYEGITSDVITVTAVNNLSQVILSEITNDLTNNDIVFKLTDNYGNNVSELATFYVESAAIPGNSYKPLTTGSISVYAVYRGFTSNTIDIDIYDATHTTKILVEDFTGTWCGYCPRVAYKLEQAVNNNVNIIPIGVHDDADMFYEHVKQMESVFNISGFPTAIINRIYKWGENESEFSTFVNKSVGLGLSVSSTKSGDNIDITTQVHFDLSYTENLKLVVCLVEDGLLYDQDNYENYYSGNPIVDFEHNNVLQKAYTDIFGDEIPVNETVRGNTYERVFNVTVPDNVQNSDNTKIIAYVVKSDNNEVINVQKANINTSQDFD